MRRQTLLCNLHRNASRCRHVARTHFNRPIIYLLFDRRKNKSRNLRSRSVYKFNIQDGRRAICQLTLFCFNFQRSMPRSTTESDEKISITRCYEIVALRTLRKVTYVDNAERTIDCDATRHCSRLMKSRHTSFISISFVFTVRNRVGV